MRGDLREKGMEVVKCVCLERATAGSAEAKYDVGWKKEDEDSAASGE